VACAEGLALRAAPQLYLRDLPGAIADIFALSKELHILPKTPAFYRHPLQKPYATGVLTPYVHASFTELLPVYLFGISI
jgi:hypothetical protein